LVVFGYRYYRNNIAMFFLEQHSIFWKEGVEIDFDDFKGEPDYDSDNDYNMFHGMVFHGEDVQTGSVRAYFDQSKSWIKLDSITEKIKLSVMVRFDIYEIYTRKFNHRIEEMRKIEHTSMADLEQEGRIIYNELKKFEEEVGQIDLPFEERKAFIFSLLNQKLEEFE
jgi:hypothetical protein